MNLGQKLAQNLVVQGMAKRLKEQADLEREQKKRSKVIEFYENFKAVIESSIKLGNVPQGKDIPYEFYRQKEEHSRPIWDEIELLDKGAYANFQDWCAENGLQCEFVFWHDGVGINGGFKLQVKPLAM